MPRLAKRGARRRPRAWILTSILALALLGSTIWRWHQAGQPGIAVAPRAVTDIEPYTVVQASMLRWTIALDFPIHAANAQRLWTRSELHDVMKGREMITVRRIHLGDLLTKENVKPMDDARFSHGHPIEVISFDLPITHLPPGFEGREACVAIGAIEASDSGPHEHWFAEAATVVDVAPPINSLELVRANLRVAVSMVPASAFAVIDGLSREGWVPILAQSHVPCERPE